MDIRVILVFFAFIYFFGCCFGLPVKEAEVEKDLDPKDKENELNEKKIEGEMDDLGLEYGRYLQQVVEALEQDKEFAKKLENVSQDEIKNGAIAKELDFVHHDVRNKLDELKRIEMDRLRALAKKERQLEDGNSNDNDGRRWRTLGADSQALSLDAEHLDHQNPHSFEAQDLQKLILSATKDLEELDAKRKEDFKSYEMEKELKYREALVNMTEEERLKTIKKHDEMQEKHKQHPKVHHPGSKKQLEQVWEEQDHMPREEFNPKVFFTLHDINGDGFLDPQEVEAILTVEIKKMYSEKNAEDDPNEMQEEFHRMREHIYKEADSNKDGLISKKEFLDFTHRMEFERDDGWKGLDEQQVYSEDELKKFQHQQRAEYERREQYAAYQQQQHPQYYPEGYHPQQQQQFHNPNANYDHYIPDPHQMTQEQWAQQQQYYQQQYGLPNAQLHPQQQQLLQQQLHHQQQQQQQQYHQQMGGQPMNGQPMIANQHMNDQQMSGHPQQQMAGHPQQQMSGHPQQMGVAPQVQQMGVHPQIANQQQMGGQQHPPQQIPVQQMSGQQQQPMGVHPSQGLPVGVQSHPNSQQFQGVNPQQQQPAVNPQQKRN